MFSVFDLKLGFQGFFFSHSFSVLIFPRFLKRFWCSITICSFSYLEMGMSEENREERTYRIYIEEVEGNNRLWYSFSLSRMLKIWYAFLLIFRDCCSRHQLYFLQLPIFTYIFLNYTNNDSIIFPWSTSFCRS